jgi:hypothetical protein
VTTTYTLTATKTTTGCTTTDSVIATVDTNVPIVSAGSDFTITCVSNTSGRTIGENPESGYSYVWSPSTGLSNTNSANPVANPTITTTYTVRKTNSTSGSFFGIWNNEAVYSGNAGYGVYMCKPQIELNSFATPWGLSRTSGNSLRSLVAIPTIVQVYPNSVTYNNDNTFSYNGTSNYSSSESSVFPASSQPGSVCAWVKVEDLSVKQTVFSYGQVAGTSAGRTLYVGPGNSITYSGGTGAGALELVVTPSLATGVWYNIVGVFDGTTVFIYLNGELLGSSALALFTGFFSLVYYGRDLSAQNNYLKGQIASILSYDRALMPFEILQNFNATRKSFNV